MDGNIVTKTLSGRETSDKFKYCRVYLFMWLIESGTCGLRPAVTGAGSALSALILYQISRYFLGN